MSFDLASNFCIMKRLLNRGDRGERKLYFIFSFIVRIVRGTILCFLLHGDIIVYIDIKRGLDMRHNLSVQ